MRYSPGCSFPAIDVITAIISKASGMRWTLTDRILILNLRNFASLVVIVASRFSTFSLPLSAASSCSSSSLVEMLHVSVAINTARFLFAYRQACHSGLYPTVESAPSMSSLLFAQPPFRLPEPDDCSNIRLSSLRISRKKFDIPYRLSHVVSPFLFLYFF